MTTVISELDGGRTIELEVKGESAFIAGPGGVCWEFDAAALRTAFRLEFGIMEPLEQGLQQLLEATGGAKGATA